MKNPDNNKAQGALEYMAQYGWMILVVAVVGVFAWRMGYLDLGGAASATGSSGFQSVRVVDYRLRQCSYTSPAYRGWLDMGVVNAEPGNIRIERISVCPREGGCMDDWYLLNDSGTQVDSVCGDTLYSACDNDSTECPLIPSGDTDRLLAAFYEGDSELQEEHQTLDVVISYQDIKSGLRHQSRGAIWGPIEDHT